MLESGHESSCRQACQRWLAEQQQQQAAAPVMLVADRFAKVRLSSPYDQAVGTGPCGINIGQGLYNLLSCRSTTMVW